MKRITLKRTDEEAEEVNIPVGETVIGRGPFLKCTDKRISRNHGLIKLTENGDIILTSKHLNPIYYSEKRQPMIEVNSGNSVTLNDGDEFALLPDSYRFRVAIMSNIKTQNGHINGESVVDKCVMKEEMKEKEERQVTVNKCVIEEEMQKTECSEIKQEVQSESENAVDHCSDDYADGPKRFRNLPTWMSQDSSVAAGTSTVKKDRKRKENVKKETVNKKAKVTPKKKKTDECSDDEDGIDNGDKNKMEVDNKTRGSSVSVNKTKPHELSDEEEENKNDVAEDQASTSNKEKKSDDTASTVKKDGTRKENVNKETVNKKANIMSKEKKTDDEAEIDNGDSNKMEVDNKTCGNNVSLNKTKLHELSDGEEENKNDVAEDKASTSNKEKKSDDTEQSIDQPASPGNQNVATNNRQKCLYAANCYRKNPRHRTDFSHPGDADYDDGKIPECEFGLLCYRKNKQHRLDFKHTIMPQQQNILQNKKRKDTVTRRNYYIEDSDDEEDNSEYDDPFLNDASSDDYQPTNSDSENSGATSDGEVEEDTKRMLKEAKRFSKKKK